jgi:hypothetical protein
VGVFQQSVLNCSALCGLIFNNRSKTPFIREGQKFVHSQCNYLHNASSRPALKGRNTPAQGAALCIRSLVHSFVRAFVRPRIRSSAHSRIRLFTHPFNRPSVLLELCSFAFPFICAFVHPPIRSSHLRVFVHSPIRSSAHSFIRPFVHPRIRLFVHSHMR